MILDIGKKNISRKEFNYNLIFKNQLKCMDYVIKVISFHLSIIRNIKIKIYHFGYLKLFQKMSLTHYIPSIKNSPGRLSKF